MTPSPMANQTKAGRPGVQWIAVTVSRRDLAPENVWLSGLIADS